MVNDSHLKRAYALKNPKDAEALYRDWAASYDKDVVDGLGYVAPQESVKVLLSHLKGHEKTIIDVGCGTGLVGDVIQNEHPMVCDGLDLSPEMLDIARDRGSYRNLLTGDLTSRLDLEDDLYDAAICVGTFTSGHVGPDGLREIIRITKPGGIICFTVNENVYEDQDYDQALSSLEDEGLCRRIEQHEMDYIPKEGLRAQVITIGVPEVVKN
ncbi:methyltransferase type 11 [Iodidimonas nitroreducens]|uniref:Methyltransferase type 11 n=1 Tax=Iodidimonas nitroreducens TaxID=1236968 RepID=A0A5A7N5U5_9PROT|nr:class I SAM-dependent methyltransferase [Iodidimonas nitroreducens]GAK34542.1 Williams-Beuren syndrome chromosomal region 27 protein [alpha proteobacterium Q-1]GER02790.1 methyltransferase type 11 [Iodidimonas nitroreducens]